MTKLKMLRISAAIATGVSLSTAVGMVGASAGTIDTTGPDSHNTVKFTTLSEVKLKNNNNLNLSNATGQDAYSGNAKVKHNTTGGDAASGDAKNANSVAADVSVTNSNPASCGCASAAAAPALALAGTSITNTGPDSKNEVKVENTSKVKVTNNNNVNLTNTTSQSAYSGNAEVKGNTTGGNATSGGAMNTNSAAFTVTISN